MNLQESIDRLLSQPIDEARHQGLEVLDEFRKGLSRGDFRAAEKTENGWKTNVWVKRGILLAFKIGVVTDRSIAGEFYFFDKDTLPAKNLTTSSGVRVVPGGSSIRDGAYVAKNVICMPPIIVKYRDEKTDASKMLEDALR